MFKVGDIVQINMVCNHTSERFGVDTPKKALLGNVFKIEAVKSITNDGDTVPKFAVIQGWYFCFEDLTFDDPVKEAERQKTYGINKYPSATAESVLFDINQLVL